GVPEAIVPLAGPFVALGRRPDLGAIQQVALGVSGGLQIIGLVTIVAGSTLQRSVEAFPEVSLDGGRMVAVSACAFPGERSPASRAPASCSSSAWAFGASRRAAR